MYIYYVTIDDTERRQGVEPRVECNVRSVPPWHSYITLYTGLKVHARIRTASQGCGQTYHWLKLLLIQLRGAVDYSYWLTLYIPNRVYKWPAYDTMAS